MKFKKTKTKQGLTVVTEKHQHARSVSMGLWVQTGTRDEPAGSEGVTHFLEHLVFKGTHNRNAFEIAKSLEEVGGDLNALTSLEYTCFHSLSLSRDWKRSLDVLLDLAFEMKMKAANFELEKQVVQQEIVMSEDEHEELAYELFLKEYLSPHPLARKILGTPESVQGFTSQQVKRYYFSRYQPEAIILSAAGQIDHDELVREINRRSLARKGSTMDWLQQRTAPSPRPFVAATEKPSEQLHFLLGFPSAGFRSPLRFESFFLNSILGGGMTSRLYQEVREKRGLVYTIYSSLNSFSDFGMLNIASSQSPENWKEVMAVIARILGDLKKRGITEEELKMTRLQLEGSLVLGSEDIESRMNSLAVNEMIFGEYRSVDRVIDEVRKVTRKSVKTYIDQFLDPEMMGVLFLGSGAEEAKAEFVAENPFHRRGANVQKSSRQGKGLAPL